MTSEPKGLTKKSSQGENLFLCNKFISSCIIMCIDFVAVTCIIMYCRTDMHHSVYLLGMLNSPLLTVTMVFECYFFNRLPHCIYRYGLHYNEMMMSVLQEVKGLKIIVLVGRPVLLYCQN